MDGLFHSSESPAPRSFKSGVKITLFIVIHVVGITATALTFYWIAKYTGLHWDGPERFSWHPPLMVLGLVYLLGVALSTHRLWPGSENSLKIMHLIFMVVVLVCLVVAFAIVVDFVKGHHFSTLHGWLGLIFSVIIIIEVPVFLIVFGFNISKDSRSKLMKWHIKSTFVILLLSLAVSLTGFQGHILTHNYNEITIINLTGLVIFLFITIVTYVLMVEGSGN
ncbi:plasma membrane ascorbate-dependent reductase CYBRD1-like isoform X2 [Rhodnius prolixus]|uniref:plasma membrane ascorbate-dependent reductase CYBRD1-like isoform X2 n=1 Tax=Rhodnius prolixus TaxID=13249 RepID=UPI003D18A078